MKSLWTEVNCNPDCWPTRLQELLLHAALDDGPGAMTAWESWRSSADVERLDLGSHRLLPLLYRNLSALGVEDSLMARIKGVYRRSWYENQLLFNKLTRLIILFRRAGIRTMVLKGAALSVAHYCDSGVRPMADLDILVPTPDALRAGDLIKELGWRPRGDMPDKRFLMSNRHAWEYADESGCRFDFHWNVFLGNLGENADDDFWCQAVPVEVNGEASLILCPSDQLLHVCSHGAEWNTIPPIRWVADAMTVLKSSGADVHWDRFLVQARRCSVALAAGNTLAYLRERFGVPVPVSLLEDLRRTRTTLLKRSIYRNLLLAPEKRALHIRLLSHLKEHSWRERNSGWFRKILHFPAYLATAWGLEHVWHIPWYVASTSVRRIWKTFFAF